MKGMNQPLANKGKVVLLLFLILVFCTTACKQGKLLDKTYEIPETGWAYTEPVFFETQVCDTSIGYDVVFSLKHKNNYGWSNAFFLITTVFPDMELNSKVDILAMADNSELQEEISETSEKLEKSLQELHSKIDILAATGNSGNSEDISELSEKITKSVAELNSKVDVLVDYYGYTDITGLDKDLKSIGLPRIVHTVFGAAL